MSVQFRFHLFRLTGDRRHDYISPGFSSECEKISLRLVSMQQFWLTEGFDSFKDVENREVAPLSENSCHLPVNRTRQGRLARNLGVFNQECLDDPPRLVERLHEVPVMVQWANHEVL